MSSIDDIKKKLKIDNLDKNSRKNMFNKFVEKGGKVAITGRSKSRLESAAKEISAFPINADAANEKDLKRT